MKVLHLAPLLLLQACLVSCASTPQTRDLLEQTDRSISATLIADLAFYPQEAYQCGPAALATLLSATDLTISPDDLVPLIYVPVLKGSLQPEVVAAARSFGRLVYTIPGTLQALLSEVDAGHPVLVLQNLGLAIYPQWHFAVVKGYDLNSRKIILNSGNIENYQLSLKTFERTWGRGDNWGIVALHPGTLPATAEPGSYFQALVSLLDKAEPQSEEEAISAGLQEWPDDTNLLMSYGNYLYSSAQPKQAAEQFEKVIELDPDYAPAYNNLAHIQTELGLYQAALGNITQALAIDELHTEAYEETRQRLLSLMQQ